MPIFVRSSQPYAVSTNPAHDPRIRQARNEPAAATTTASANAGDRREAGERLRGQHLAPGERPQGEDEPDQPAQPDGARGHVDHVPHDEDGRRGEGTGVPDERGPGQGEQRTGQQQRAVGRVGCRGPGAPDDHAETEQHQDGADQLVDDRAGVERRRDVGELEPLSVDGRHRHLEDEAGDARPGGVRQQAAQPRADVGALPRVRGAPARGRSRARRPAAVRRGTRP